MTHCHFCFAKARKKQDLKRPKRGPHCVNFPVASSSQSYRLDGIEPVSLMLDHEYLTKTGLIGIAAVRYSDRHINAPAKQSAWFWRVTKGSSSYWALQKQPPIYRCQSLGPAWAFVWTDCAQYGHIESRFYCPGTNTCKLCQGPAGQEDLTLRSQHRCTSLAGTAAHLPMQKSANITSRTLSTVTLPVRAPRCPTAMRSCTEAGDGGVWGGWEGGGERWGQSRQAKIRLDIGTEKAYGKGPRGGILNKGPKQRLIGSDHLKKL